MEQGSWTDKGYNPEEHNYWKATLNSENGGYPENYFFADTLRGIILAFGNYFGDLHVLRYDEKGYPRKDIIVPVKFGPRAKSHDPRVESESGKDYYISQPNLTYKIGSMQFDPNRAAAQTYTRTFYTNYLLDKGVSEETVELLFENLHPVPYNIGFEVNVSCDKMSDALQVIEQIGVKFNPESFLYTKEFWFLNVERDLRFKMDSINLQAEDTLGEEAKREITVNCNFAVEANFYKKIEDCALITEIVTKVYNTKIDDLHLLKTIDIKASDL